MIFLKKKINEFSLKNLFFIYLTLLSFFLIFSYFYLEIYLNKFPNYIDENNDIVLRSLPFEFGDLLHNLYYNNEYVQKIYPFEINFHFRTHFGNAKSSMIYTVCLVKCSFCKDGITGCTRYILVVA